MNIVTTSGQGRAVVELVGRFDAAESGGFRARIEPLLETAGVHLYLDLSRVTFLDSSALAELLRTQKSTTERGGDLTLVAPAEPVRVILGLTALEHVFTIRDDLGPDTSQ